MSVFTLTMNPAIDKNSRVGRVVAEEKLRCERPRREAGGGGINVARVLKRLDCDVRALYTAGGPTGEMLDLLLEQEEVPRHPLPIDDWTRENTIIYETSTDRQFRFGMPGPELTAVEAERCLEAVSDLDPPPDFLVASGSLPPGAPDDFYAQVATRTRGIGAKGLLDTSGDALREGGRDGWYLIKPNLRELQLLAGKEVKTETEIGHLGQQLIAAGAAQVLVVSMGASGAMLITADTVQHVRSPTVPIESRVGAGDSMVAGLAKALDDGRDLHDAVRYGVAAGAAAVMTPGTELCYADDIQDIYADMG